jgi:hypothetical protein
MICYWIIACYKEFSLKCGFWLAVGAVCKYLSGYMLLVPEFVPELNFPEFDRRPLPNKTSLDLAFCTV